MRTKRALFFALSMAVFVGSATPSGGDASGCSFYSGSPGYNGCTGSSGSCYDCLYHRGGYFSQCYENGDGSVVFCIDYQM